MADHRNIWAIFASVFVLSGGPLLLAHQVHYPNVTFWVCWIAVIAGFAIFVALILGNQLPGSRRATKAHLSVTHIRVWGEMREGSMPTEEESRYGKQGLIEVIVKCHAALPTESRAVELKSVIAKIRLDKNHVEVCRGLVTQWVDRVGEVLIYPEGFSKIPRVPPGTSIELRCGFYARAFRSPQGSGWIQPHDCRIERFELVDVLEHKHRANDLEGQQFSVSWVPALHPHQG